MRTLLNNQRCSIDNHCPGQITKGLDGLHIHKTFRNNKKYSKAVIKIPLDGKHAEWQCIGQNSEKLANECRKALADEDTLKSFVNVVVEEMRKYENETNSDYLDKEVLDKKHKEIAENILRNGFRIENLKFVDSTYKKYFGKNFNYYVFENKDSVYSSYIGKTKFTFEGKSK